MHAYEEYAKERNLYMSPELDRKDNPDISFTFNCKEWKKAFTNKDTQLWMLSWGDTFHREWLVVAKPKLNTCPNWNKILNDFEGRSISHHHGNSLENEESSLPPIRGRHSRIPETSNEESKEQSDSGHHEDDHTPYASDDLEEEEEESDED